MFVERRAFEGEIMTGIALTLSEIPIDLIETHNLRRRVHDRGGESEVRFLWRHHPCVLPVWSEGQLIIARWGCRRGETKVLPITGWAWLATLESGGFSAWEPEPVEIPATFALDRGIWYGVREGIRGLLVKDESGAAVVYALCQPASRYYEVMTRSERMPVLIGETI
jgi:hypothetical protein